jgi:hypothetical protein
MSQSQDSNYIGDTQYFSLDSDLPDIDDKLKRTEKNINENIDEGEDEGDESEGESEGEGEGDESMEEKNKLETLINELNYDSNEDSNERKRSRDSYESQSEDESQSDEDEDETEKKREKIKTKRKVFQLKKKGEKEEKIKPVVMEINKNMSLEQQKTFSEIVFDSSIRSIEILSKFNDLPSKIINNKYHVHPKMNILYYNSKLNNIAMNIKNNSEKNKYYEAITEFENVQNEYNKSLQFFTTLFYQLNNLPKDDMEKLYEYYLVNKYTVDVFSDTLTVSYEKEPTYEHLIYQTELLNKILIELRNNLCVTAYKLTNFIPKFEKNPQYTNNVNFSICQQTMDEIENGKIKRNDFEEDINFVKVFYRKIMSKVMRVLKFASIDIPYKIFKCVKTKIFESCMKIANGYLLTTCIGVAKATGKQFAMDIVFGTFSGKFDYRDPVKSLYKDYLYEGEPCVVENVIIIQIIQILALTMCKAATNPFNFWKIVNFVKDIILDVANAFTPIPFIDIVYNTVKKTLGCVSMIFAYFSTDLIKNSISAIVFSVFSVVCGTMSQFIIEPRKVALQIADNLGEVVKNKVKLLTDSIMNSYEKLEGPSVDIGVFLDDIKSPVKDVVSVGFEHVKETFEQSKYGKYVPGSLNPFNYISSNDLTTSLLGMSENQQTNKLLIAGVAGVAIGSSASEYVKNTIKDAEIDYEEDDTELNIEDEIDIIDENTDKIIEKISEEAKKRKQDIGEVFNKESESIQNEIEYMNHSIIEMLFKGANDIITESVSKVKSKAGESLNDAYNDISKNSVKILSKKIARQVKQDMKNKIEGTKKTEYLGYDKRYKMDEEEQQKKKQEDEEKERKEDEKTETIIYKLISALLSTVGSLLNMLRALTVDQLLLIIKEKSINYYNTSYEFLMSSFKSIVQEGKSCVQTLASLNLEIIKSKFYKICNNITDFVYYFKITINVLDCADEMLNIVFTDKQFTIGPTFALKQYAKSKVYSGYRKTKAYVFGKRKPKVEVEFKDDKLLKMKEEASNITKKLKEKEKLKREIKELQKESRRKKLIE